MNQTKLFCTLVVMGAFAFAGEQAHAQQQPMAYQYGPGTSELEFNLFQNFYTQPGTSVSSAAMYNAPHPVPYSVGQSHYTYQPFYPHQHLYAHKKNYYTYYGTSDQFYSDTCPGGRGGDALNKTTVVWQSGFFHLDRFPCGTWPGQKMAYDWYSQKYCLNCDEDPNGTILGSIRESLRAGFRGRGCR